ncbi:phage tail protein [Taibaiella koreensis]|uniref:phage tail protein n=1 Tax=Taibaiella koreensis TaxID=1268548 RepID=UPI000E59AA60|nr:tail fiber protein [Taibaiella koreensis]
MEGTMAVVTTWAADFSPKNWAYCYGQLLSIAQNTALFSLLGTTYGGDGRVTFGLPDLRGRMPLGTGQLAGGENYVLGEVSGNANTTLMIANLPAHNHNGSANIALQANATNGATGEPGGNFPGMLNNGYSNSVPDATMTAPTYNTTIGVSGASIPYNNQSPYLALNYIICMYGIFPSRN